MSAILVAGRRVALAFAPRAGGAAAGAPATAGLPAGDGLTVRDSG